MSTKHQTAFVCRCFFTNNYFIKNYNIHVLFLNDEQLKSSYQKVLEELGCDTEEKFQNVLLELHKEKSRRENVGQEFLRRKEIIQNKYQRLHPEIFHLERKYLDPEFLKLVEFCKSKTKTKEDVVPLIHKEHAEEVYSFPVFTEEFCEKFMEEMSHFEASDCPKGRPNTMNKYGVLLNELGFDDNFLNPLQKDYLHHITKHLYPEYGGDYLDSHKAFVVKYKLGQDLDLSYHYDNAEVTLNVAMGGGFEGGTLYFGDMRGVELSETECTQYEHVPGRGLLHRGQHMHGALKILSGERYNLIIWMRSSKIRNQCCPMCNRKPELVQVEGCGDGFTEEENNTDDVCSMV